MLNYADVPNILAGMTDEQIEAVHMLVQAKSCVPVTGRYANVNKVFENIGSEYGLMRFRVSMEIEYLISFCKEVGIAISEEEAKAIRSIDSNFDIKSFFGIKTFEKTTNHDVKAVEYFIDGELDKLGLERLKPFVHIGLTSEDTNNFAHANQIYNMREIWLVKANELVEAMKELAYFNAESVMAGHTHGQMATPLTFGHAMAVDWNRLDYLCRKIEYDRICVKLNGAVGNKAALIAAYPEHDWETFELNFIESYGKCSFERNPLTGQIESHDYIVELLEDMQLFCKVVENVCKNLWLYISYDYLHQVPKATETGSSTMPHKVNPIDAENGWANAFFAWFVMAGLSNKLPTTMGQRDLSDSSTMRNVPVAFLYSYQAMESLIKIIGKVEFNQNKAYVDLDEHPELLAELIQVVLRKNGYSNAYDILKNLTRGKKITMKELREFVKGLDIDGNDKEMLLTIEPQNYIGNSIALANTCYDEF